MKHEHSFFHSSPLRTLVRREIVAVIVLALVALLVFSMQHQRDRGFKSVELKFADISAMGMQIVPASCPSDPHTGGECYAQAYYQGYYQGAYSAQSYYQGNYYAQGSYASCTPICGSATTINNSCTGALIENCVASHGAGWTCSNGTCIPPAQQCTAQYFCQGADLYYKNSQCVNSFIQTCAYGCTGGACGAPPPPQLKIQSKPALIHSGNTSNVGWRATNVSTCTVTGTNGNSWTGADVGCASSMCKSSADGASCSSSVDCGAGTVCLMNKCIQGKPTSAITTQVIYSLSCTGNDGTHPVATTSVDIVPDWQDL